MEVKAELKYLPLAPRKVRLVADRVRNMDVGRAELALANMPKRAGTPLRKLLRSALANARHNFQAGGDNFYIKSIRVGPGPVAKRTRARAFGRAAAIRKRTSHVFMLLDARGPATAARRETGEKRVSPVRQRAPESATYDGVKPRRNSAPEQKLNPKAPGAIRRIFQRKAI